jgi:mannose-6-phosphate isomerase-like protein (cupin superfamily)
MDYRDESNSYQSIWIEPGEMIIVPRGVEHCPVAEEECDVLLFEPASTLNTGNTENEFTRKKLQQI